MIFKINKKTLQLRAFLLMLLATAFSIALFAAENFEINDVGNDEQLSFVRLTPSQYRNTIHDIFGESIRVSGNGSSGGVREFGLMALGDRKLTLSASELESYESLAIDISSQIQVLTHQG